MSLQTVTRSDSGSEKTSEQHLPKFATIAANESNQNDAVFQASPADQQKVNQLSAIVAKELNVSEPDGGAAYRAVSLPGVGDLRAVAAAFGKTVVGYDLAPVLKGTKSPFSTIGGVSVGSIPDTVFINARGERPHLSILRHELAHELRRSRSFAGNRAGNQNF